MYKWIQSFVTDRVQFVQINQNFSNPKPVLSGIPQGSVIGPILFLLYMDDVTKVVSKHTTVSLFADDAKFYSHDIVQVLNEKKWCLWEKNNVKLKLHRSLP